MHGLAAMASRDYHEPFGSEELGAGARPPVTKPSKLASSIALLRKQNGGGLSRSSSKNGSAANTPRRKQGGTQLPASRGLQSPLASSLGPSTLGPASLLPSSLKSSQRLNNVSGDGLLSNPYRSLSHDAAAAGSPTKAVRVVSTFKKFEPDAFKSMDDETGSSVSDEREPKSEATSATESEGGAATIVAKAAVQKCLEFPVEAGDLDASRFVKLKLLGKGAIGKVYLVRLQQDEKKQEGRELRYALKVVTKEEMVKKNKVQRVMTEREVLATTAHPYIVAMYASFQTQSRLYYCMEYMAGGEFFRMLQRQPGKRLSEDAARFYAAEVTLALEYLHHMGFVYRDLKPENVLLRGDGHLALADFDLSKQATASAPKVVQKRVGLKDRLKGSLALKNSNSALRMDQLELVSKAPIIAGDARSFVGTEEYLAPEVVSGTQQQATVDFWTLGIFIYEMLYGETPFKGAQQDETFRNILTQELKFPADVSVSKDAKDLMRKLLTRNAAKRLGAERGASELREHKWFASLNLDLMRNQEPPIKIEVEEDPAWAQCTATLADLEAKSAAKENSASSAFSGFETHKNV
mmetsp:Transcript_940/g.2604  ORF Transcript_940/g.2604 Transcript_940/m.2604 type:complete len:579 (-) Transcript_940:962-2698(-)